MRTSLHRLRDSVTYEATVNGQTIHCRSLADALLLMVAEHAAIAPNESGLFGDLLEQAIAVAKKYELAELAAKLQRLLQAPVPAQPTTE
jgi:hypothetical protein